MPVVLFLSAPERIRHWLSLAIVVVFGLTDPYLLTVLNFRGRDRLCHALVAEHSQEEKQEWKHRSTPESSRVEQKCHANDEWLLLLQVCCWLSSMLPGRGIRHRHCNDTCAKGKKSHQGNDKTNETNNLQKEKQLALYASETYRVTFRELFNER